MLFTFMDDYCLNQEVNVPTRGENILDLVLSNNDEFVKELRILYNPQSDHDIVVIDTNVLTSEQDFPSGHRDFSTLSFGQLNFWSKNINWPDLKERDCRY